MSQKGCRFPNAPYPYRGSPGALGWGLGLVQALSRHPASSVPWQCSGPPYPAPERGQEHLGLLPGSPTATAAAPLAFLRVLIGQGAQPLAPLSPEMSQGENLTCKRARTGSWSAALGRGSRRPGWAWGQWVPASQWSPLLQPL